ncbi:MAG: diacylglycerol kinase [Bdellovibrionota bacterium]
MLDNKKSSSLFGSVRFAVRGLRIIFLTERNFRIQVLCLLAALTTFAFFRAEPMWWAVFAVISGFVLALEALNSAIERLLDHLHPDFHLEVGLIKDCSAAAVLIVSIASIVVFVAFILSHSERLRGF